MATKVTTIPTPLTVTDLDFDGILMNFKEYMKSQDTWQDYNFEGSAITELLKLLAYNTFYNSFYVNNIANEMYLDTASERSAVVSRAKALGYVPASQKSSYIYVDLLAKVNKVNGEVTPTSSSFITLMPYAKLSSSVQDQDYQFLTTEQNNLYYTSDGGDYWIYEKKNVRIVEGKVYSFSWKVQNEYDKYIIPNTGVDLSTLNVRIYENSNSLNYNTFSRNTSITNITASDQVYWIYEGEDQKFYFEFGNDIYGKKVNIGNIVYIEYIIGNGKAANGSRIFDISIGDYSYSDTTITEKQALEVINSNYVILGLDNVSHTFTKDSLVRGSTSNNTAYVYSYDYLNEYLMLYSSANTFINGETITEETVLGSNVVYGASADIVNIRTRTSTSEGGADIESIDSIKFNAPKFFASQNRLVTANDYETVIKNNYPYIDSIKCWGGEEETPVELGTVYVSIKPKSRESLEIWEKDYIQTNIIGPKQYIGLVGVNIIDPEYVYIHVTSDIKYNNDIGGTTTKESILKDIKTKINDFNLTNLSGFDKNFYYSNFVSNIDSSNDNILSNSTTTKLLKVYEPSLDININDSIKFHNEINSDINEIILSSSDFTCNVDSYFYDNCHFEVANTTILVSNTTSTVIDNAGTIDYTNGVISFSNVTITDTALYNTSNTNIINIYVNPLNLDITSSKNLILGIDNDLNITMTPIVVK